MAAVPASFSTETFSMSEGLSLLKLALSDTRPSMTISGSLLFIVPIPRMLMLSWLSAGSLLRCWMTRLGEVPCSACVRLATERSVMASDLIWSTAPTARRRVVVP